MINPEDFFCISDNRENVIVTAKGLDNMNREVWVELLDSFTADDLTTFANFFEHRARAMRGEHLN